MERIKNHKMRVQTTKPGKSSFGDYIYELRFDSKLTLRDLRTATGIPLTRLSAYEHGSSSPDLEALRTLSRAFKMPLYRFLRPLT
jgi:transcriptional regulator with XRE-family HTH domain